MSIHRIYNALSPRLRRGRMQRFCATIAPQAGERVLDVGGTSWIWDEHPIPAEITLLNPVAPDGPGRGESTKSETHATGKNRFVIATGDGCALPYADGAFDVVFSNSVIEHVGSWERQRAFAAEARRVGRRLWIQTPAREFFLEPHLIAPFIHWLPPHWQRRLARHFTVRGWLERRDPGALEALMAELRLLTWREMQALFPDCTIRRERFLGFTKSYIAVRS